MFPLTDLLPSLLLLICMRGGRAVAVVETPPTPTPTLAPTQKMGYTTEIATAAARAVEGEEEVREEGEGAGDLRVRMATEGIKKSCIAQL